jgi:Glutathione S-transferase, C-terminal domain
VLVQTFPEVPMLSGASAAGRAASAVRSLARKAGSMFGKPAVCCLLFRKSSRPVHAPSNEAELTLRADDRRLVPHASFGTGFGGAMRQIAVQEFAEVPALPEEGRLREAALALLDLERDIFVLWCRWLFQALDEAGEARAKARFQKAMEMVDGALANVGGTGPFFLGESISMVDLMVVPFLERQNSSLLSWKGFRIRNGGYENIDRHV